MRIFAFTFAGGSAMFFNELEQCAGPQLKFVKLEYPGHGTRMLETLCQDFSELTEDLYPTIREKLQDSEPYALLGYSMGSIVAVEMLRKIMTQGEFPLPKRVFLAAHEPHAKVELSGITGDEANGMIMERTMRFGGIPEKLLSNRTFWRLYLPIYRADYTMLWKYDFNKINIETTIPATFFYSETDTPLEEMLKWKRFFRGETKFVRFEGNHFFIYDYCQEMADIIRESALDEL